MRREAITEEGRDGIDMIPSDALRTLLVGSEHTAARG